MAQFLNFGNGGDGVATFSGTDSPLDSSCSGSSGSTSLSATNASFAAGQQILIHQTRGTSAGSYEVNYIVTYSAGTITTLIPLVNTYTDSGNSQAQVLVLKQYSEVNISGTLTAKAWDGDVGGILAFLCNGKTTIANTISADGKGFVGGAVSTNPPTGLGYQGEGSLGASARSYSANGNGGGGGASNTDIAAGGGNGTAGTTGSTAVAGAVAGSADLTTMVFGGGGGAGAAGGGGGEAGGAGGAGGGIILIFSRNLIISSPASVTNNGEQGSNFNSGNESGGGAGGAGGSIFFKSQTADIGAGFVSVSGAIGGLGNVGSVQGGTGGLGRIRIEACSSTGTTNPAASESIGGFNFCGGASAIIG